MGATISTMGFGRKDRRSFGHRVDVPGEAQCFQVPNEPPGEAAEGIQIRERIVVESERLQKREDIIQSACEEIVPAFGQAADEETEDGSVAHPLLEVRFEHRQLVQIGQQSRVEPARAVPRDVASSG